MKYMNAAEAAREIGVSEPTIRRWLKSGRLVSTKRDSGEYAITENDLITAQKKRSKRRMTSRERSVNARLQSLEAEIAKQEQRIAEIEQRLSSARYIIAEKTERADVEASIAKHTRTAENPSKKPTNHKQKHPLPDGCILALEFAKSHSVPWGTFRDHMIIGLGPGLPCGNVDDVIPAKDHIDFSERPKPGREHEKERYLDQAQQRDVLDFWKRHGVNFGQCELLLCPCQGGEA
jgi:DNA-binding transcriptional MerR regulator